MPVKILFKKQFEGTGEHPKAGDTGENLTFEGSKASWVKWNFMQTWALLPKTPTSSHVAEVRDQVWDIRGGIWITNWAASQRGCQNSRNSKICICTGEIPRGWVENYWQPERNHGDANFYSPQGRQSLEYESPWSEGVGKQFRLPIPSP